MVRLESIQLYFRPWRGSVPIPRFLNAYSTLFQPLHVIFEFYRFVLELVLTLKECTCLLHFGLGLVPRPFWRAVAYLALRLIFDLPVLTLLQPTRSWWGRIGELMFLHLFIQPGLYCCLFGNLRGQSWMHIPRSPYWYFLHRSWLPLGTEVLLVLQTLLTLLEVDVIPSFVTKFLDNLNTGLPLLNMW